MPQLTVEQRVFVVRTYYESHSFAEVQRLFRLQFPDRNPPDKANIWRNVQKYLNNGTSWNMNSKKCGRKRTGRSDDNIEVSLNLVELVFTRGSSTIVFGFVEVLKELNRYDNISCLVLY